MLMKLTPEIKVSKTLYNVNFFQSKQISGILEGFVRVNK